MPVSCVQFKGNSLLQYNQLKFLNKKENIPGSDGFCGFRYERRQTQMNTYGLCGSISVHQRSSAVCRNQSYATTKSVRTRDIQSEKIRR